MQRDVLALDGADLRERSLLPFLEVAHHAEPGAVARGLEDALIVGGLSRLHEEDLDERARLLAEVDGGLGDPRVVEDEQRPFRQVGGEVCEHVLADLPLAVEQQLRLVALLERILGDALRGQRVVVVGYVNMFCF